MALTAAVCLAGCSKGDSDRPYDGSAMLVFSGINSTEDVSDVMVLLFDAHKVLTGTITGGNELLDGDRVSLDKKEGSICFAAVNTRNHYRLSPSILIPGQTKADDIIFEKLPDSRSDSEVPNALCGSATRSSTTTKISLKSMTEINITVGGWIVREVEVIF